jgi:hypothetical protein
MMFRLWHLETLAGKVMGCAQLTVLLEGGVGVEVEVEVVAKERNLMAWRKWVQKARPLQVKRDDDAQKQTTMWNMERVPRLLVASMLKGVIQNGKGMKSLKHR